MTLANRTMTTVADVITTIDTGRFTNITNQWGGNNSTFVGAPDWGVMIWQIGSVYPDFVGPVGWVILCALPFVMMWLAHADMVPAAGVGIFFGLYMFTFVGSEYQFVAIVLMAMAIASIIWSIWQKRG